MQTRILTVDPRELRLLDLNARFMTQPTYKRLVENVKGDGDLTSTPFCAPAGTAEALTGADPTLLGTWEVLSGNHRVKASIDAGLPTIEVKVTDEDLPRRQRIGIQLSHNSLSGEDDPATLKQLYESLDVDWKVYSGLDDKTLGLLNQVKTGSLSEANLDFQTLSIVFLPEEMDRLKAALEAAKPLIRGADTRWALRWSEYDRLLDSLSDAGASYNVTNVATEMMVLLSIVERHLPELSQGWAGEDEPQHKGHVPLASLFGRGRLPAKDAQTLKKALALARKSEHLDDQKPCDALVLWAQAYLDSKAVAPAAA